MAEPPQNLGNDPWTMPTMYSEFAQRGARYAYSILRNTADCEDVVHEAFCRLLAGKNKPDRNRSFAPLFFTTVRNICIDRVRLRQRQKSVSLHQVNEPIDQRTEWNSGNDLAIRVQELISELPDHWADALRLRIDGELSYDEIASVMQCTRAQIRTWIFRARRQLETELQRSNYIQPIESHDRR